MPSQDFFGGRVQIKSLLLTGQPATRPEFRARILSPKGELAVLSDLGQEIRHLAHLELRKDVLRGGHYHKLRHEYFYLISGEALLHLEDISTGTKTAASLNPGDLAFIQPGIAHAFVPLSSGHALEFAAEPFDPDDVFPHHTPR